MVDRCFAEAFESNDSRITAEIFTLSLSPKSLKKIHGHGSAPAKSCRIRIFRRTSEAPLQLLLQVPRHRVR